jgi:plastocyanin
MRRALTTAVLVLVVTALGSPATAIGQTQIRTVEIVVTGRDRWAYQPSNLVIRVGETVEWVNRDPDDAHNVSIAGLDYDGRYLGLGESDQVTFTRPGRYRYTCLPHPSMSGMVIVLGDVYVPFSTKGRPVD